MARADDGKRKRVTRACDLCRSRKLKCDGGLPACSRCAASANPLQCLYTHTAKRPTKKQRAQKNSQQGGPLQERAPVPVPTMADLDQRMSRMEGLITALVGKLDPSQPAQNNNENDNDDEEDSSDETFDEDISSRESQAELADHCDTTKLGVHHKYFGSQSTLSVLSAKGLLWLGKRIGDPTLLPTFQSFHTKTAAMFLWTNRRWIEPIERADICPFPSRERSVELIDHFYYDFCFGSFILKKEELVELFDTYYRAAEGSRSGRRLTNSDFLTMSVTMAVGAEFMGDFSPGLSDQRRAMLLDFRERMTNNAIYYYNRVSIISEGLRTVQALMLFSFFTELTRSPPHNYILVSTLVRFAQEIGLHRRESLVGLSKEEAIYRRKIWLLVYIFDRNCCLMSGKPPIINAEDVSSVLSHEMDDVLFHGIAPAVVEQLKDVEFDATAAVEELEKNSDDPNAYMKSPLSMLAPYYHSIFSEFTTKAYNKLFSAQALRGKSLPQVLIVIEELNGDLEWLKSFMNKKLRPGADLNEIKSVRMRNDVATIHFQYHQLSMIINRMAFTRAWLNHDSTDEFMNSSNSTTSPLQSKLMLKCLDQARSIVHLVDQLSPHPQQMFTHYACFQFFSAFFTLFTGLLEFPKSEHFKNDVDLLFKVSYGLMDGISQKSNFADVCTYNIVCYSVRFFLRIAILTHNQEDPASAIDTMFINEEMNKFEKILSDLSAKCNHKLRINDPLCVNPPLKETATTTSATSQGNGTHPSSTLHHVHKNPSNSSRSISSTSSSPNQINQLAQQPLQRPPMDQRASFSQQQQQQQHMFPNINGDNDPLFGTFPMGGVNSSGMPSTGQTPDEKSLEMLSLEIFEGERHSNILQQVFALPDFYLNAGDAAEFDGGANLMF